MPVYEKYKEQLLNAMEENDHINGKALLELLYTCYTEEKPIDNRKIQEQFARVDDIMSKLSLDENNSVFLLICSLCEEYAKEAFYLGLEVGFGLSAEILRK